MKKKTLLCALGLIGILGLTSCGRDTTGTTVTGPTTEVEENPHISVTWKTEKAEWFVGETNQIVTTLEDSSQTPDWTFDSSNENVLTVTSEGLVTVVGAGNASIVVKENMTELAKTLNVLAFADKNASFVNGPRTYTDLSYAQKGEILGTLEKYAIDKGLTGTSLFENGGYMLINPRIQKGTENYITGYGFGILSEGKITADMANETNPEWKKYYHNVTSEDPATVNVMGSNGSLVSNLANYISTSYYGTRMNETKDGYVWYPVLAKEAPVAINPAENGQATKWKIKLRTGADGVTYRTNSTKYAAFDERKVELDDYVNSYRVLLTQHYGLFRSAENTTNEGALVGSDKYYERTKEKTYDPDGSKFLEDVTGLVPNKEDNSITFELKKPVSQFYAQYFLNSYNPLPQEFLDAIGGIEYYGNFGEDNGTTPVDNFLSLGNYYLETWESDQAITYKRNDTWFETKLPETRDRYTIPGIHTKVLKALNSDPEAAFKEYIAGNIDSCPVPSTKIKEYATHEDVVITKGDSVFKLNFNALDQETWVSIFGENGSVIQTAPKDYYNCKPIMHNSNFIKGFGFAIDRETYAKNRGVVASQNYFSGNYLINPEEGISYNDTQAHKKAIEDYFPETYGYNKEAAVKLFSLAVDELVDNGDYELGTKANPTVVSVVVSWMNPNDTSEYGNEIEKYIEDAFNDPAVCGGRLKLDLVNENGTTNYEEVYDKMQTGQFDIGFGSISGMDNDPLGFMEVLKSDNSTLFTLNWGVDTSVPSKELYYDGAYWSFDGLWEAAKKGAYFENGYATPTAAAELKVASLLESGNLAVEFLFETMNIEGCVSSLLQVCFYSTATNDEVNLTGSVKVDKGVASFEVPKEWLDKNVDFEKGTVCYVCVYFKTVINGVESVMEIDLGLMLKA